MKNTGLIKGCLEPLLLKLLGEQRRMYGYEIVQKVKEQTAGKIVITEGALYPLLHKLEANGILEVEVENIGNRLRKYYTLTQQGKKEKSKALAELKEFSNLLQTLLNPKLA